MTTCRLGLTVPLLFVLLVLSEISVAESRLHSDHDRGREKQGVSRLSLTDVTGPWSDFHFFVGAEPGEVRVGLASIKKYFLKFGYIDPSQAPPAGRTFSDTFDDVTRNAVIMYQRSFSLNVTGNLDFATLSQMVIPRCGREDVINGTLLMLQNGLSPPSSNGTQHLGVHRFSTFSGNPRWTKLNLTYAIDASSLPPDVDLTDIQIAIDSAFAKWSAVTPLIFTRIPSLGTASMKVSFAQGDHGDGSPFDGPGGVVAHGFAPQSGILHFDLGDTWTVDVKKKTHAGDKDLETVAIHEIGHLLGLGHTSVYDAVMYPVVYSLTEKRKLNVDDVEGIQALYGRNTIASPSPRTGATVGDLNTTGTSWSRMRSADVVVAVATSAALASWLTLASPSW